MLLETSSGMLNKEESRNNNFLNVSDRSKYGL